MKLTKINLLVVSTLFIFLVAGMGCGLSNKRLKQIGTVIAIGVAAKLIYDMVIDYQSEQVANEDKVIDEYKKKHQHLPLEPELVAYESSLKPGDVVKVGEPILIVSSLQVVPGRSSPSVTIEEKITIYDNEDNSKALKSLVKPVNEKTKAGGAYENLFTFKLPKGMPQGIYPVKTIVIVNGKAFEPKDNRMQLVLNDEFEHQYRLALVDERE